MVSGLSGEVRAHHADLSATQVRFLDFLAKHPEGLTWPHYAPIHVTDEFTPFAVQSWPVFLGADRRRRCEQAACAVSRLIRSIPRRFFGNDAVRLGEFYDLSKDQAVLVAALTRNAGQFDGEIARCDFLDTPQGLKCVELNAGNVSGWQTAKYLDRFARVPAIRRFVEQESERVLFRNPIRALFEHFIEDGRELAHEGELNFCFAVDSASHLGHWVGYLSQEYAAVMAEVGEGLEGALVACDAASLKAEKGALWAGGRRIQIVQQPSFGRLTRPLLAALLAKKVRLFNGPTSRVLTDKGNLALLSESLGTNLLTAEEQEAVAAWIPWTHRVVAESAEFDGEKVYLPAWLLAERAHLVLKARVSLGGKEVHVGRFIDPEAWALLVRQALADGRWVVQEYVESQPYLFLGESGCVPHDLVWGLFTFGDRYGGNFFRVQAQSDASRGVVNATQGASFGLILEVEVEGDGARGFEPFLAAHPSGEGAGPLPLAVSGQARGVQGGEVGEGEVEEDLHCGGFLSQPQQRFAHWVAEQPPAVLRSTADALRAHQGSTKASATPWPLFVPVSKSRELARVAAQVARLVLDLPRRVFANRPGRLQDFYGLAEDQAQLIATLVDTTAVLDGVAACGEFLDTGEGVKCLAFEVGWEPAIWFQREVVQNTLAEPLVVSFLEQAGLDARCEVPAQVLLRQIFQEASALSEDGEFNLALVVPSAEDLAANPGWAAAVAEEFQRTLAAWPRHRGTAISCSLADLREEKRVLCCGERRVHAVVDACAGQLTRPMISSLLNGTVKVYSGPVQRMLSDRLNLALLSGLVDSELLDAAESDIVRAHIPWTRALTTDFVDFEGERHYLPDLLCDQRERMVIKGSGRGPGEQIVVGPKTSAQAWEQKVEQSLGEPGWVAQEFLQGKPYLFPQEEAAGGSLGPCAVVWGLLTLGGHGAGGFARLVPCTAAGEVEGESMDLVLTLLEVEEKPLGEQV